MHPKEHCHCERSEENQPGLPRRPIGLLATTISLFFLFSVPASAQERISTHKDWVVYSHQEKNKTLCFIGSKPLKETGSFRKRSDPHAWIMTRKGGDEFSVTSGYPYRKDAANVSVDGRKFAMFTEGETAWAREEGDDQALINAMRKGSNLTVKGTSQRGTTSIDSYSLAGFTAAYQAMHGACLK